MSWNKNSNSNRFEWNDHRRDIPEGAHAFLSPSQHSWLNYTKEKLITVFLNSKAKEMGTRLHLLAKELISLRVKLPNRKKTLNAYVNDAIGFDLTPEVGLFYSKYAFGTADAISFENNLLRIHDLKTGVTPANMSQLHCYAALFCLEYKVDPMTIEYETRIYQNDEIVVDNPNGEEIQTIMNLIVEHTKTLTEIEGGRYD